MMKNKSELEDKLRYIQTNLYTFYRYYVARTFKENIPAPHIRKIAYQIMRLYRGDFHRLCVALPPRHSKSSLITEAFPLWLIFHNPNLNILIVNNSAGLSERFGIQLRELIKKYGEEFNVLLSDVKSSSTYLMFSNNEGKLYSGSIRLVGAGGSITGQDVDYLIIDDPYEGFTDITPSLLNKKINWFKTIIEQRIEPHTRLVILHTRWHSKDLQGYLKETASDDYEFISLPAILPTGEPLWSERYTIDELEKKRQSMGERLFSSIYQQEPLDESGDFFNFNYIQFTRPDESIEQTVRSWDIATGKSKESDYTSGVLCSKCGDKFLIRGLVHGKFGDDNLNQIRTTAQIDGTHVPILIETGVGNADLLYTEWKNQLNGYNVEQSKPKGSKEDRATPFKYALLDGKVYIDIPDGQEREALFQELRGFPLSEHDDIIDSISYAYNYFFNKNNKQVDVGEFFYVNL